MILLIDYKQLYIIWEAEVGKESKKKPDLEKIREDVIKRAEKLVKKKGKNG